MAQEHVDFHRVEVLEEPSRRVAYIRHVGPYLQVGPTFQRIKTWAGSKDLVNDSTEILGMGLDDPSQTPPEQCRFDCGVTVPDGVEADGEVQIKTVPGGSYARLRLIGRYEHLPDAYGYLLGTWLPASGRQLRQQPPWEVYRNDPAEVQHEELVTDIYLALED